MAHGGGAHRDGEAGAVIRRNCGVGRRLLVASVDPWSPERKRWLQAQLKSKEVERGKNFHAAAVDGL
jgi:hypothetical protein